MTMVSTFDFNSCLIHLYCKGYCTYYASQGTSSQRSSKNISSSRSAAKVVQAAATRCEGNRLKITEATGTLW